MLAYLYPMLRLALHHSSLLPFEKDRSFNTEIELSWLWYPCSSSGYLSDLFIEKNQFAKQSETYLKYPFLVPYTPRVVSLRYEDKESIYKLIEYKNSQLYSDSKWGKIYRDNLAGKFGYQYYIPEYGVLLNTNDIDFDFDKDIKLIVRK